MPSWTVRVWTRGEGGGYNPRKRLLGPEKKAETMRRKGGGVLFSGGKSFLSKKGEKRFIGVSKGAGKKITRANGGRH